MCHIPSCSLCLFQPIATLVHIDRLCDQWTRHEKESHETHCKAFTIRLLCTKKLHCTYFWDRPTAVSAYFAGVVRKQDQYTPPSRVRQNAVLLGTAASYYSLRTDHTPPSWPR